MITGCLRTGFKLANKNYQLVFYRMAAALIHLAGLVLFIGLPLAVSAVYMGFDIAHAKDILFQTAVNPLSLLARYASLLFIFGGSFFLYLIFASVIFMYTLGGTLGVLNTSAADPAYKCSSSSFIQEGRKSISRLLPLLTVESIVTAGLFFILVILITGAYDLSGGEDLLRVFLHSFVKLSFIILSMVVLSVWLMFVMLSLIVSAAEVGSVSETLRKTTAFLRRNPGAILFSFIVFTCFMVVNCGFLFLKFLFALFPLLFAGNIILSVIVLALQNYLTIIIWGVFITYYLRKAGYQFFAGGYEI